MPLIVDISVDPASRKPHIAAEWQDGELVRCAPLAGKFSGLRYVWIESQFAGRNTGSSIALAQAAGNAAGFHFDLKHTEVVWLDPARWKAALCKPFGESTKKPTSRTDYLESGYGVERAVVQSLSLIERVRVGVILERVRSYQTRLDYFDAIGIGLVGLGRTHPKPTK